MSLFCDNCLIVTFIPSYVFDFEGTSGSAMREKILPVAFFRQREENRRNTGTETSQLAEQVF